MILRPKRFHVSGDAVRSANDTYRLADIQHMRLRRPLLTLVLGVGAGITAITCVFWSELYPAERVTIVTVTALVVLVASRIARLELNALALSDGDGVLWGETGEMRRLKSEIEQALSLSARTVPKSTPAIPPDLITAAPDTE